MTVALSTFRRRWKRWAALVVILAIGSGVWMASGESETVRKARGLQLGMTEAEVRSIMGRPADVMGRSPSRPKFLVCVFATPTESWLRRQKEKLFAFGAQLGVVSKPPVLDWPVRVQFNRNQRVILICRGSEVIKAETETPTEGLGSQLRRAAVKSSPTNQSSGTK